MSVIRFKILFVVLMLLHSSNLFAQVKIINTTVTPSLIKGVENNLQIKACGVADSLLKVKSSVGEISKIKNGEYKFTYCGSGESATWIYIFKTNKLIDSSYYWLQRIPNPELMTGMHDSIYQNFALVGIRVDFANELFKEYVKPILVKYDVVLKPKGAKAIPMTIKGAYYTRDFIDALKKLCEGDIVELKNFVVQIGCELQPRMLEKTFTYYFAYGSKPIQW